MTQRVVRRKYEKDGRRARRPEREQGRGQGREQAEQPAAAPVEQENVELTIDTLASGGAGVGRDAGGRVLFVPKSAPGDRLLVQITEQKKSYARGRIVEVLQAGEGRAEPVCPLFVDDRCGGCQWQHLSAEVQARAKQDIVARELRKLVARGMRVLPIIAETPAYKWRRRARLHYARPHGATRALVGFYGAGDRRVVDVDACPQLTPALADALALVREHLAPHLGSRGHIDMLAGHDGHVHVTITGYCAPRRAAKLVGKAGVHGTIMGVALYQPAHKSARLEERGRTQREEADEDSGENPAEPMQWGKRYVPLEPGLRGRADLFAQASEAGNRALVEAVDQAAGPRAEKRVLELFAGSGNLSRVLERDARSLTVSDSRAVPWMRDMVVGEADRVLIELLEDGRYFDLVVLDPPRTGAAEVMDALVDLHPQRIVYVSCDPATLARDLERLVEGGYRAEYAQPLDLMPQTAHVEVVVALSAEHEPDEHDQPRD